MNTPAPSASASITARIEQLGDWRGAMLARVRELIHQADPEVQEEWKWMGTPVWSHAGILCTGETYNKVVKLTFARGAALSDPSGLFNSSLEGKVRRAIDIHQNDTIDEPALKSLIRAAVAFNLEVKARPKAPASSRKRTARLPASSKPSPRLLSSPAPSVSSKPRSRAPVAPK